MVQGSRVYTVEEFEAIIEQSESENRLLELIDGRLSKKCLPNFTASSEENLEQFCLSAL